MKINELAEYCNDLLEVGNYIDYCHNGLQVAGKAEINNIVAGVSICDELIDKAILLQAGAILVHHGLFWKNEDFLRIIGVKRDRLAKLLINNINLLGYHLPLDFHGQFGNNYQLAKILGISAVTKMPQDSQPQYLYGQLSHTVPGDAFATHIEKCLRRKPLHIPAKNKEIMTIAWCSGGGADYLKEIAESNGIQIDAYLTGEIRENSPYIAREFNVHLFAAGHYATERCGIQVLGEHLAKKFNLKYHFIDIDNPV